MTTTAFQEGRVEALARVNAEDPLAALLAPLVRHGGETV